MTMTRTYDCTDDASGGASVEIEAATAAEALADYIERALGDPSAYNQGEDGAGTLIRASAAWEDEETGDVDVADGWIDFGGDDAWERVDAARRLSAELAAAADRAPIQTYADGPQEYDSGALAEVRRLAGSPS